MLTCKSSEVNDTLVSDLLCKPKLNHNYKTTDLHLLHMTYLSRAFTAGGNKGSEALLPLIFSVGVLQLPQALHLSSQTRPSQGIVLLPPLPSFQHLINIPFLPTCLHGSQLPTQICVKCSQAEERKSLPLLRGEKGK